MSNWWGGKKASLDYWSYYWILSVERSKIVGIEKNRGWPQQPALAEGLMLAGPKMQRR